MLVDDVTITSGTGSSTGALSLSLDAITIRDVSTHKHDDKMKDR